MSAAGAASQPVEVGHPKRFIASVHGGSADKLVHVDVDNPDNNWERDARDGIQNFQLIGGQQTVSRL